MGRDVHTLFDVFHPAFPLPTTASSAFQGALRDSFGEAVMALDMPESCKFPSLDLLLQESSARVINRDTHIA